MDLTDSLREATSHAVIGRDYVLDLWERPHDPTKIVYSGRDLSRSSDRYQIAVRQNGSLSVSLIPPQATPTQLPIYRVVHDGNREVLQPIVPDEHRTLTATIHDIDDDHDVTFHHVLPLEPGGEYQIGIYRFRLPAEQDLRGTSLPHLPTFPSEVALATFLRQRGIDEASIRNALLELNQRSSDEARRFAVVDTNKGPRQRVRFVSVDDARPTMTLLGYIDVRAKTHEPLAEKSAGPTKLNALQVDAIARGILAAQDERTERYETPSSPEEKERKTVALKGRLAAFAVLDVANAEVVDFKSFGRTVPALRVPCLSAPRDAHDDPPRFLLLPLEHHGSFDVWWLTDAHTRAARAPDELTSEQEQQLFISVYQYYAEASLDPRARQDAEILWKLQQRLVPLHLTMSVDDGNISITSRLRADEFVYVTLSFPSPFHMDENWMTQWSDIPANIRVAILEIFPADMMTVSIVHRIRDEIKNAIKEQKIVHQRYISFVADWNLLPKPLRQQALAKLSPDEQQAWVHIVLSQEVHDGSAPTPMRN